MKHNKINPIMTFTCKCDDCEVTKFGSVDYEAFPINSKGKRIGTSFLSKCPECEVDALLEEYDSDYMFKRKGIYYEL